MVPIVTAPQQFMSFTPDIGRRSDAASLCSEVISVCFRNISSNVSLVSWGQLLPFPAGPPAPFPRRPPGPSRGKRRACDLRPLFGLAAQVGAGFAPFDPAEPVQGP